MLTMFNDYVAKPAQLAMQSSFLKPVTDWGFNKAKEAVLNTASDALGMDANELASTINRVTGNPLLQIGARLVLSASGFYMPVVASTLLSQAMEVFTTPENKEDKNSIRSMVNRYVTPLAAMYVTTFAPPAIAEYAGCAAKYGVNYVAAKADAYISDYCAQAVKPLDNYAQSLVDNWIPQEFASYAKTALVKAENFAKDCCVKEVAKKLRS